MQSTKKRIFHTPRLALVATTTLVRWFYHPMDNGPKYLLLATKRIADDWCGSSGKDDECCYCCWHCCRSQRSTARVVGPTILATIADLLGQYHTNSESLIEWVVDTRPFQPQIVLRNGRPTNCHWRGFAKWDHRLPTSPSIRPVRPASYIHRPQSNGYYYHYHWWKRLVWKNSLALVVSKSREETRREEESREWRVRESL
jgi:hypothetical protein